MSAIQIKSVNNWHEHIVTLQLQHPEWRQNDIAVFLNRSPAWVSTITGTDAFEAYRTERIARHNEKVSDRTIENVEEMSNAALEEINRRIKDDTKPLPTTVLLDAAQLGLKSLGYGLPKGGNAVVGNLQINVGSVDADLIARAREKMISRNADPIPAVEVLDPIPA